MIITTILITVAIINIILSILISSRGPKDKVNLFYGLITFSVSIWSVALYFFRILQDPKLIILTGKVIYIFAAAIALFFLYFTLIFPKKIFSKKIFNILIISGFLFILFLIIWPNALIKDYILQKGINSLVWNWTYVLYVLYIMTYFGLGFLILILNYKKSVGIEKLQIKYVFLGTFISSFLAIITNLFLVWFGDFRFNWLGPLFTMVMVILIAYAIVKHHLMNIKVIATEIFAGSIALILLINFLTSTTATEWLIRGFLLIVGTIFSYLTIRGVLKEVKTREQMEKLAGELGIANEKLKQLDQAKTEFLSIASHQLRSPLMVI